VSLVDDMLVELSLLCEFCDDEKVARGFDDLIADWCT